MTFPIECQYHAPLEPYDYGDEELDERRLSRRFVTARIVHRCNRYGCRKPIAPGERYIREFWLIDQQPRYIKRHVNCDWGS